MKIVDNSVKFEPEKGRVIVSSKPAGGEGIGVELDVALRAMEVSILRMVCLLTIVTH